MLEKLTLQLREFNYKYFEIGLFSFVAVMIGVHVMGEINDASERMKERLEKTIYIASYVMNEQFLERKANGEPTTEEEQNRSRERLNAVADAFDIDSLFIIARTPDGLDYLAKSDDKVFEQDGVLQTSYGLDQLEALLEQVDSLDETRLYEFDNDVGTGLYKQFRTASGRRYAIGAEYFRSLVAFEILEELGELTLILMLLPVLYYGQRVISHSKSYIEEKGMHDELTDFYNRKVLKKLQLQCQQNDNQHIEIYYFDLDGLKRVNDTQGHDAGDAMILRFVEVVKNCFRMSDVKVRMGGDEFMVLADIGDMSAKDNLLSRLRKQAEEHDVAFSVGVVSFYSSPAMDLYKQIERADELMYEEKVTKKTSRTPTTPAA